MKDRKPKYPGRVMLTPVEGQNGVYDMERADEPENEGTPLNKNTLLKDETAKAMGLDPENDPTLDDAWNKIMEKFYEPKVGDIVETVRTDLGENWVLCNGDAVHEDAYPELYGVLPYNTGWRRVPVNGIQIRPLPKDGEWEIILSEYSPYSPSSSGQKIGLYNSNTETYIEIAKPVLNTTIGYGIFGITHDGDRYILGVVEDNNDKVVGVIHLFASTDLETWAECYSFECKSSGYVPYQLTFDGLNIVCIEKYYSTSYAHRIVAINKAMTKTTVLLSSGSNDNPYYLRQLPSGYWSYGIKDVNAIIVYPAGERKSPLFTLDRYYTSDSYVASAAFFNEKFWITLPKSGGSTSCVLVTNLKTNGGLHIPIGNIIDIGVDVYYYNGFYGAVYDRNTDEWLLYVKFSLTDNASDIKYYVIYVPQNFDWEAPTKCRYEEIASIPKDLTNEQMALDKSRIRTVSTSEVYISNPNIKFLPTHDGDTYKYIYAGGTPSLTKDGLIMYCDGINNTGGGHDATVTTWKDLSRHGNDLINVGSITETEPSATLRGEWLDDGMHVIRSQNQILRTVNEFEFGTDRTIEFRFTANAEAYMTFGLYYGDRVKYRKSNERFWVRFGESENSSAYDVNTGKKSVHNIPTTVTMSRQYNAATDTTLCKAYVDGVYCGEKAFGGNYRDSESGFVYIGSEQLNLTMHAVRVYDRALTDEEIMNNYKYDDYHFDAAKGDADE